MGSPKCLLMLVAALVLAVTSAAGQGTVKRSLDKAAEAKAAGAKAAEPKAAEAKAAGAKAAEPKAAGAKAAGAQAAEPKAGGAKAAGAQAEPKAAGAKAAGAQRARAAGAAPSKKAPAAGTRPKASPAAKGAASDRPAGTATRRDPFVTPISKAATKADQPSCAGPGKRSLLLSQTALRGVARTPGGMIAVVTTSGNRTYFLRENDQVCNGRVVKVSEDSLVYEENLLDALGRVKKLEQVMKIPPEK